MQLSEILKKRRSELGYTLLEIANRMNVSEATVQRWESGNIKSLRYERIAKLADVLQIEPSALMGWEKKPSPVSIPVLGYVRAGIPIEAVEEILDYEEISSELAATGEFFALSIKGDSMEPKMSEGDVVIVRKQESVENGETAVVLVNGNDATVKKFYRSDSGIKLISTNPVYEPFFFTPKEVNELPVSVIGKVVELRAKF